MAVHCKLFYLGMDVLFLTDAMYLWFCSHGCMPSDSYHFIYLSGESFNFACHCVCTCINLVEGTEIGLQSHIKGTHLPVWGQKAGPQGKQLHFRVNTNWEIVCYRHMHLTDTLWNTKFAFLPRVWWGDWYYSYVCTVHMKHQQPVCAWQELNLQTSVSASLTPLSAVINHMNLGGRASLCAIFFCCFCNNCFCHHVDSKTSF